MKKSLLALAVLGAFATAAQAQVTIGGVLQANLKDYKVGNSTRNTQTEIRVDDDYNSRFWLTGSEDLGGGNAALFYVENRLDTDTGAGVGSGIAAGDTFFGLKGGWGQFTAGRHSLMYANGLATEAVLGNGGMSAMPSGMWATVSVLDYVGSQGISTSRVANSLKYTTPNMGGFTAFVGWSPSASTEGTCANTGACAADYSKGQTYVLNGNYTNGPIYADLAYFNNTTEGRASATTVTTANADSSQVRLNGYYKFPFGLKVGMQVDRASLKDVGRTAAGGGATQTRTAWSLPVSYAFGNSTILGSYTKAGNISNSGGVSNGAKMYTLGYDYSLSKRTDVGVYYSKLSNDTAGTYVPFLAGVLVGSAPAAGESATTIALGMKHTF